MCVTVIALLTTALFQPLVCHLPTADPSHRTRTVGETIQLCYPMPQLVSSYLP